jgi:hypothetical protein
MCNVFATIFSFLILACAVHTRNETVKELDFKILMGFMLFFSAHLNKKTLCICETVVMESNLHTFNFPAYEKRALYIYIYIYIYIKRARARAHARTHTVCVLFFSSLLNFSTIASISTEFLMMTEVLPG